MSTVTDRTAPQARNRAPIHGSARRLLAVSAVALSALAGCSGSSSGTGGLSVTPATASFAVGEHDPLPAPKTFAITVSNKNAAYVGAAFVGTPPPWLALNLDGAGSSWTLRAAITTTDLAPGSYHATIRVGIARSNQSILATEDVNVDYTISAKLRASPSSLVFSAAEGGPATSPQTITVTGSALPWTASAGATWLHLTGTSGTGPGAVQVTADPSQLAPGDYTGTVTLQASGVPDVPVTASLHVEPAALTVEPRLTFAGTNGAGIPSQTLHLGTNNGVAVEWTATASDPWIVLDHGTGTTSDTITVGVDATRGPLASGDHAGTIALSGTLGARTLAATVNVSLSLVKPTLTIQPASLVLGGPVGRDLQAKEVTLSLDAGVAAFPWAASTQQPWVVPSTAAGTVSAAPSSITVAPDATGLAGGTYASSLAFSVAVNGDLVTATLPVRLDLDDHRLVVSDTGVAFAKTPSLSSVSRTLKVLDNFGLSTGWTATSSKSWLTVTSSGTTAGDLVLSADPTGLAADTVHTASVTVRSSDPDVSATETIQVGLWVGAADPAAATTLSVASTAVITDPVRPYAYVHAGGSSITVYNVFTTQVVATIASVAAQLGSMAVAQDGSTLWAVDRTGFRIVPVDLATRTVGTPFAVGAAVGPSVQYARTNGKALILAGNRCIYDAATGAVRYPAAGCTSTSSYPVSSSVMGNIFSIDATAYRLDYTAMGGGTVIVGSPLSPNVTRWNSEDYAFSPDGSRMYLAVGSPYDFYVVDTTVAGTSLPQVQVLPGAAYPNNVEVARDGRIFAAIDGYADSSGHDAWIFSPDGTQLKAFNLAYYGIGVGSLRISGDGLRMVSLPNGAYLTPEAIAFHTTVP